MPYKSEKIKLDETQDRRRKLTENQKEEIKKKYSLGISQRNLAKEYNVSRGLIQIIVNPQIAEAKRNRIKEHWRDYRPTKEEWAATIREHRRYKQELYVKGELKY